MGEYADKEKNSYKDFRNLALLRAKDDPKGSTIDKNEPYKVLVEFFVSESPVSVLCALDGTVSLYVGSGAGLLNYDIGNDTIRQIAKSVVFESKNIIENMEEVSFFPPAENGKVSIYVVTERSIYGTIVSQDALSEKTSELWKIYYLAVEIMSMHMNS